MILSHCYIVLTTIQILVTKMVWSNITIYVANDKIIDCAKHISEQINGNYVLIAHYEYNDIDLLLKYFNKNSIFLADMSKHDNTKLSIYRTDMYVFVIENIDEFMKILLLSINTAYWNPRANFLILFYGTEHIDMLFKIFWEYYITNLVVIFRNRHNIDLYTYFPYSLESCNNTVKVKLSVNCENATLDTLFPEKVPFNMRGCAVKYGPTIFDPFVIDPNVTTDDPQIAGIEMVIIKNFLDTMNLQGIMSDYNPHGEWGMKEADGSFTGPYNYLALRTSEFVFGHMWANMAYVADFDMSNPYYSSDIFWYVPSALPTKQWKSTFIIFTPSLWITVIVLFLLNSFVSWGFGRCVNDAQQLQDLGLCFLHSLYSLCTGSFFLPRKLPTKIIVLNWTIFGLLLSLIYQSKLLTLLTSPSYEHQISNLHEMVESSLEIIIPFDAIQTMNAYRTELTDKILELSHALGYEDIMRRSTSDIDGNSAFLQVTCCAKYLQSKYYTNDDGSSKIYKLEDDPFLWFGTCIFTLKGFPLLKRFDEIILWFRQSGLLAKWERDLDTTLEDTTSSFNSEPIVLNLDHFISAFCLLILGLLFSLIGFVAELLVHKYKK